MWVKIQLCVYSKLNLRCSFISFPGLNCASLPSDLWTRSGIFIQLNAPEANLSLEFDNHNTNPQIRVQILHLGGLNTSLPVPSHTCMERSQIKMGFNGFAEFFHLCWGKSHSIVESVIIYLCIDVNRCRIMPEHYCLKSMCTAGSGYLFPVHFVMILSVHHRVPWASPSRCTQIAVTANYNLTLAKPPSFCTS